MGPGQVDNKQLSKQQIQFIKTKQLVNTSQSLVITLCADFSQSFRLDLNSARLTESLMFVGMEFHFAITLIEKAVLLNCGTQ